LPVAAAASLLLLLSCDKTQTLTPNDNSQSDIVRLNISAVPSIQNPEAWLAAETLKLAQQPSSEPQTPKPSVAESAIVGRVQRVGQKAHGLVPWQGAYILLDSESGALMALDLTGAAAGKGFNLHKLWQAAEPGV
jgi:hypothetical protein